MKGQRLHFGAGMRKFTQPTMIESHHVTRSTASNIGPSWNLEIVRRLQTVLDGMLVLYQSGLLQEALIVRVNEVNWKIQSLF